MIFGAVGLELPQHPATGAVEVLEIGDPFGIGDLGQPVVAVVLVPRGAAFGIGHCGEGARARVGILHRSTNWIPDLRHPPGAVIVQGELAAIGARDGGDVEAAPLPDRRTGHLSAFIVEKHTNISHLELVLSGHPSAMTA